MDLALARTAYLSSLTDRRIKSVQHISHLPVRMSFQVAYSDHRFSPITRGKTALLGTLIQLTPSRSSSLSDSAEQEWLLATRRKSCIHGTPIALSQIGRFGNRSARGSLRTSAKTPRSREVGRRMLYVGFGSISGIVHLIARLPMIGRAAAILLIIAALIAPIR